MDEKVQYHAAGQLLRGMVDIQRASQAGPLTIASISGAEKSMADVASCSFGKNRVPDNFFLPCFSTTFPLPHQNYWKHVHLTIDMTLLMTLMLHGERLTLQQWITSYKPKTGTTGWDYPHTRNNILTCRTAPSPSIITSSSVFLRGTGRDTTVGAVMWHKSLSC